MNEHGAWVLTEAEEAQFIGGEDDHLEAAYEARYSLPEMDDDGGDSRDDYYDNDFYDNEGDF